MFANQSERSPEVKDLTFKFKIKQRATLNNPVYILFLGIAGKQ